MLEKLDCLMQKKKKNLISHHVTKINKNEQCTLNYKVSGIKHDKEFSVTFGYAKKVLTRT